MTRALAELLREAGVERIHGVTGGGIARFVAAAADAGLDVVHARHEGGAAFMASEASIATGRPTVIYTTTGPGLTNALTGIIGGAWEGAQLIVVTGGTRTDRLGRFAFQETSSGALDRMPLFPKGLRHRCVALRSSADLSQLAAALRELEARPGGFVLQVLVPHDAQVRATEPVRLPPPASPASWDEAAITRAMRTLERSTTALWLGFGARRSAPAVARLAAHLGCPVMATPRAKGSFPERDPAYIGVTGFGGHASVHTVLAADQPETIIVLGSRLGEFASYWDERYIGDATLIHVDVDAQVFGRAFPGVLTLPVRADVETFVARALAELRPRPALERRLAAPFPLTPELDTPAGLHPLALMAAVQRQVVDESDAIVLAEAGNAFAWAGHALAFDRPRYRASTTFGAMGEASAGVVGVATATGERTVAIVGDGAMLMNNELSSAAERRAPCVWVVLNDASYGMIRHGMRAIGLRPVATQIPRVDFVAFANAQGVEARRVETRAQLDPALREAMTSAGPFLLDVRVDPTAAPPFDGRNASLRDPSDSSGEWQIISQD